MCWQLAPFCFLLANLLMAHLFNQLPLDLIVNAGGKSRRMGQTKALLPVPPAAMPLIAYIITRLSPVVLAGGKIVVVTDDADIGAVVAELDERVQVVGDRWSHGGALGGVASGLALCEQWAMVVACDMLLVSAELFGHLVNVAMSQPEIDAVMPVVSGQPQPFHGLWHSRLLPGLEACLSAGELGVIAALQGQRVAWVDVQTLGMNADDDAFLNVNTPLEWDALLARLQK